MGGINNGAPCQKYKAFLLPNFVCKCQGLSAIPRALGPELGAALGTRERRKMEGKGPIGQLIKVQRKDSFLGIMLEMKRIIVYGP